MAADEGQAMDMEPSLTSFTINDNGAAAQSAGGSLLVWPHDLQLQDDDEAAEFFDDRASSDYGQAAVGDDDSGVAYQFDDPESGFLTTDEMLWYAVVNFSLLALQQEVDFETIVDRVFGGAHIVGGDGGLLGAAAVVPASDAAVAGLEKQAFHATATAEGCGGVTGCAICLEDFENGEEVTVMPFTRGHEFHPECITKWLGKSNTCPLCRHALPTDVVDDGL